MTSSALIRYLFLPVGFYAGLRVAGTFEFSRQNIPVAGKLTSCQEPASPGNIEI
jgi:hypothetical protein